MTTEVITNESTTDLVSEVLNLLPYQQEVVSKIISTPNIAIFMDMGLGKTITVLKAVNDLLKARKVNQVLVVAPLFVTRYVWPQELSKWHSSLPYVNWINLAAYSKADILKQESKLMTYNLHLCNVDKLDFLTQGGAHEWLESYDMLIIDESSIFKSHSTKRFAFIKSILSSFSRRVIMTGTPIPNGYANLWSQMYIIDLGKRLGKNITEYRKRFFHEVVVGNGIRKYELKRGADAEIQTAVNDICVTIKADEVNITLPPISYNVISIPMPPALQKDYNDFEKKLVYGTKGIHANNAATLINKLMQFSSGAIYYDDNTSHDTDYELIHNLKIQKLHELMEATNRNVIIVYNYIHELIRIKSCFPEAITLKSQGDDSWNQGKVRMLLLNVHQAAFGLNLQKGGSIIVWFGFTWALDEYQQLNKRVHRLGQTYPVSIYHLCVSKIERKLISVLHKKDVTQSTFIDVLSEHYNNERKKFTTEDTCLSS